MHLKFGSGKAKTQTIVKKSIGIKKSLASMSIL